MTSYSSNLPQHSYKAEQVLTNEGLIAEKTAIEMYRLMQTAGQAVFELISELSSKMSSQQRCRKMTVLCGHGNNGGDGYIVAQLGLQVGWQVRLIQVGPVEKISGDALRARSDFMAAGGVEVQAYPSNYDFADDIVIDALLGIGLTGPVRAEFAAWIEQVNQLDNLVVSVDVPSGLDATTGNVSNLAIRADACCTFIALKQGLLTAKGPDHCGQLYFAGLGLADAFQQQIPASCISVGLSELSVNMAPRALDCHKGSFGHLVLIGGEQTMAGAIRLAAEAALRSGVGLVTVLCHPSNQLSIAAACAELMVVAVELKQDITPWLDKASVIAIGPGLAQGDWGHDMLQSTLAYLAEHAKPCLFDADALNILAQYKFYPRLSVDYNVITPHPAEAARLLVSNNAQVQQQRFAAARQLVAKTGAVVVLKGVGTVIANSKFEAEPQYINRSGNPGMATAGMGDVLSGIIAALMAQGFTPTDAAVLGCYIHGVAADLAAAQGQRGLMASDVIAALRTVVNPEIMNSSVDQ